MARTRWRPMFCQTCEAMSRAVWGRPETGAKPGCRSRNGSTVVICRVRPPGPQLSNPATWQPRRVFHAMRGRPLERTIGRPRSRAMKAHVGKVSGGTAMSDDKAKTAADRKRINVNEDYECRYWSEKFGVSADELKRAVERVGPMADDVARALGKAA